MLHIALLTPSHSGSPKVLAETLAPLIEETNNEVKIYYRANALLRLTKVDKKKFKLLKNILRKIQAFSDKRLFRTLKKKDLIIICGTTPFAFYRDTYNIEKLKTILPGLPIFYYAVQYLGNSPSLIKRLKNGNHKLFERYDWHLSVSPITEVRVKNKNCWSAIGLNLKSSGLRPVKKDKYFAVIDFVQPGFKDYRREQISVLEELRIPYFCLQKKYSTDAIRNIYRKASIFFLQSMEAFGLPIAECLATGSFIVCASSSWPMSWRLDENPRMHAPGQLPDCFLVYNNREDLVQKLKKNMQDYDLVETPQKVFKTFIDYYPDFYYGNKENLMTSFNNYNLLV